MKVALKELRETFVCLKIISQMNYVPSENLKIIAKENDELISIFVKSISTAKSRMK